MWVRKRLDIRWSDLGSALRDCITTWNRAAAADDLEDLWSAAGDAFACLSVRTGFDLWLKALELPPGSEVLVSAITIPDMVRIIEAHGLVPIPVDVDPDDLSIDRESLERAITSRTRAILVAHLFGTRQPLEPILEFAQLHSLFVAEDCAQAFSGRHYTGHPQADVSMFSFGSIKTATALGGALLCVRDAEVLARMQKLQAGYPIQSRGGFAKRVFKYSLMKLMSYGVPFAALVWSLRLMRRNPEQFVTSLTRGFPGPNLLTLIRRQPSAPLVALMHRRIAFFNRRSLARRTQRGQRLLSLLPASVPSPGSQSKTHCFWVFPVLHDDPSRLIRRLFNAGFDASRAHSLYVVSPPADRSELRAIMAEAMLPLIVNLPCYGEMPDFELRHLAEEVRASVRLQTWKAPHGQTKSRSDVTPIGSRLQNGSP
ncbi:MAG TPA: aminotransferase class V-fold PLP-dependent enzyme [Pirellulales bacterium]|jgi:dTDP-4-amino-4,6-dideoxygalactose transaminase|nr:aminotransferase class V-fold PLP-dependent enzyme [Pirellulales bacterium]